MRAIWGVDGPVFDLVSHLTGQDMRGADRHGLAVFDSKANLVAGVIFHDWNPKGGTIEVSAASHSPNWATRTVLQAITAYAYQTCACDALIARTSEHNTRTRRLWKALGAEEYLIPRIYDRKAAMAVLVLREEVWAESKFARNYGKK